MDQTVGRDFLKGQSVVGRWWAGEGGWKQMKSHSPRLIAEVQNRPAVELVARHY